METASRMTSAEISAASHGKPRTPDQFKRLQLGAKFTHKQIAFSRSATVSR